MIVSVSLYRTNIIASPLSFCIELYNDTWSVIPTPWDDKGLWQSYDRPVYRYQGGNPLINDTDVVVLVYSGDRWFGVRQRQGERLFSKEGQEFLKAAATNYHGE